MTVLLAIISVFLLCFILYKAAKLFIDSIRIIADDGLLSKFLLASIFGGVATSVPEIFVGISAALEKKPTVALGNALGSNIADLALVVPLVVLISGSALKVGKEEFSVKNIFLILASSLLPFLLAVDGGISRIDGLFLTTMFFVYIIYLFQKRPRRLSFGIFSFLRKFNHQLRKKDVRRAFGLLFLSLLILIIASDLLVKIAVFLSWMLQMRIFLVSIFLLALGTSLPELFVSIGAVKSKDEAILFGDIFGSLITNANLVIGISALINPLSLTNFSQYTVSILALFFSFVLFIVFSYTKSKIEKWESLVMISVYLIFFLLETMF